MLYPQEGGWCKIPAIQAPSTDLKVFCFMFRSEGGELAFANSDGLFDVIHLLKHFERRNSDL